MEEVAGSNPASRTIKREVIHRVPLKILFLRNKPKKTKTAFRRALWINPLQSERL
jgi:hypothetical protein